MFKKIVLTHFFIVLSLISFSQDLIKSFYLDDNGKEVDSINAIFFVKQYRSTNPNVELVEKKYNKEDYLVSEISYSNRDSSIIHGKAIYYKKNNLSSISNYSFGKREGKRITYYSELNDSVIHILENYKNDKLEDSLFTYFRNGNIKRREFYKNDARLFGKCYGIDGSDTTFYDLYVEPKFSLDITIGVWISQNINYPQEAIDKNIQERLYFDFIIDTLGNVSDVKCLKGKSPILIAESLRVIKSLPDFSPALVDGEPVKSRFQVPIAFKFDENSTIVDEELNEANKNWKKGDVLKDPYTRQKIESFMKNGEKYYKVFYFKYDEVTKKTVTELQLEYLNELKFSSKKSCKKYYKWL